MKSKLEIRALELIEAATGGKLREETPDWLLRPAGRECAGHWGLVRDIYRALTDFELPNDMPATDKRFVDAILEDESGIRIVEIDGSQHFNRYRRLTLEMYPADIPLGFDGDVWMARSGFKDGSKSTRRASPRPPLFPGTGGRHRQRAFRDALTDLLPPLYGFLPTLRIGYFEEKMYMRVPDPVAVMRELLVAKGCL